MKTITSMTGLCVVMFGLLASACNKPQPAVKVDPHSPEAVNNVLQQQPALLSTAFKTNDLLFIHNQMYYIGTFVDALSRKLEGDKKERVDPILVELKQIIEEIDNSAGRRHKDATEANLENFYAVLKRLDAEFKPAITNR
ncbi:MAG: hypothetical protein HY298_06365 [Verrucomicrobia bacterium]|nr:hypothetical protein [Verrucomicrobiota bacterium]